MARAGRWPRVRRGADPGPVERRAVRGRSAPAPGPGAAGAPARQLPDQLPQWPRGRGRGRRGRGRHRLRRVLPGVRSAGLRRGRRDRRRRRRGAAGRAGRGRRRPGRPTRLPAGRDRGRRRAGDGPDRVGGHRRHHLVHQHLQPDGHGRGRAAGPERRGPRAACRADGQDLPGPGLQGRDRLSRGGRAHGSAGRPWASPWSATAARRASATPGRWMRRSRRRSRPTTWSWPRSCPATATSRDASIRSRARATWPRRRWSWPSPWPGGWTST